MLTIPGQAQFFLHQEPVDMRKSFEGLGAIIEREFPEKLLSGAYFIFINKLRNRLKILYFDGDGIAIWYKRLEKGTFQKSKKIDSLITRRELLMLLEGIIPKRLSRRYKP
jgi:transposase